MVASALGGAHRRAATGEPAQRRDTAMTGHPRPAAPMYIQRGFLVSGVLLFSLVLIRAPILMGERVTISIYGLSLLPFGLAIVSLTLLRRPSWRPSRGLLIAITYLLMIMVAALRGVDVGTISPQAAGLQSVHFILLALLAAGAFLGEPAAHRRERYLRALCWAPVVYVVTNVALHLAGIGPATTGYRSEGAYLPATTLQAFGVSMSRVQFPLSGGVNAFGPICAIALAICATLWCSRRQRILAVLGGLVCLYAILAIDSRGALSFGLLAVALVVLIPRARHRGLGWVGITLPLLPILLVMTLGALSTSMAASLSRSGVGVADITAGTGRTAVWREAARTLAAFRVDNVIGYGQAGQVVSGTSVDYAYIFRGYLDPLGASAHNLLLQTGLDLGWLGILIVVALVSVVLLRLAQHSEAPFHRALLAATLAAVLVGIVEAAPTTSNAESFMFWILVMFAAMRETEPLAESSDGAPEPTLHTELTRVRGSLPAHTDLLRSDE